MKLYHFLYPIIGLGAGFFSVFASIYYQNANWLTMGGAVLVSVFALFLSAGTGRGNNRACLLGVVLTVTSFIFYLGSFFILSVSYFGVHEPLQIGGINDCFFDEGFVCYDEAQMNGDVITFQMENDFRTPINLLPIDTSYLHVIGSETCTNITSMTIGNRNIFVQPVTEWQPGEVKEINLVCNDEPIRGEYISVDIGLLYTQESFLFSRPRKGLVGVRVD